MGLKAYKKKRNFKVTSEPAGKVEKRKRGEAIFVVQEHHASHLHYDFRLEMEGVLRSWAVPKGPSLDPSNKRLAMEVEDHPMSYAYFEGEIPAGEYGGGHVIVWDMGTWEAEGDPVAAYHKGHIDLVLKGKKLKGKWRLIRTGGREQEPGPRSKWLLVKRSDGAAKPGYDVIADKPRSVISGKSIRDVPLTPRKGRTVSKKAFPVAKTKHKFSSKKSPRKKKVRVPEFVSMPLAKLVASAPADAEWVHELKFDGYRTLARIADGEVRFLTREGHDWSDKYGVLAEPFRELDTDGTLVDGEIVVLDPEGKSDFQLLQNALSEGRADELVFYAFDLPFLDGEDLRDMPLSERKERLAALLASTPEGGALRYSDHVTGQGEELFRQSCGFRLEGIVSKLLDSAYMGGRGGSWLKTKCENRQEVVIGGWSEPRGTRKGIGALLLGVYENGKLRYVGKTGTGFSHQSLLDMHAKLSAIEVDEAPFDNPPRERGTHWVKPRLAAEVKFASWTGGGHLRQAAFLGLREDKAVAKIKRESPESKGKVGKKKATTRAAKKGPKAPPVKLTNPDRVLFADVGVTKQGLADYYKAVAKWLLPHTANRPLTLVRCPQGGDKECFYQKHGEKGFTAHLDRTDIRQPGPNNPTREYLSLTGIEGVLELVQMGTLEIHSWVAKVDDPLHPDQVIFDLDPDPGVGWKEVVEGALELRDLLLELGLESFIKLSGGKGVHLHVPIARRYTWDEVKAFARTVSQELEERRPTRYTTNVRKAARKGKIFIDYLRNGFGATAVIPYGVRNRPGAPVAVPIAWEELSVKLKPNAFSMAKTLVRLKKLKKDPWKGILKMEQEISILETGRGKRAA